MKSYYVPALEDLYVGYEYESYSAPSLQDLDKSIWKKEIIKDGAAFRWAAHAVNDFPEFTRVAYITEEDLDKEGWIVSEDRRIKGDFEITLFGMMIREGFKNATFMTIDRILPKRQPVYNGSCDSINEFRKICKLIGA